ncbi:MAG: transketolase [Candidatus Aenigmarchaeota archaeon]|nr:transketolase [Candidatus Aenigmarchaeota archaeon]
MQDNLKAVANNIRKDIIKMTAEAGSGHPGGSLSCVEILVSLYFSVMNHKPEDPEWEGRDRFVLSKGHAAPALYAVLARSGYFPLEELATLRKLNSRLQGHPHRKSLPGIEASTGSLGQGFSIAVGMALGLKSDSRPNKVYVLLGDGEIQEGQVWEAANTASHYKLDNLIAILDHNGLQIDGHVKDVMNIYPIEKKWEAFGWDVITVDDGHDFEKLLAAFEKAKQQKGRPTIIIANTVKGKGVSFMENRAEWHGKAPTKEQAEIALRELETW